MSKIISHFLKEKASINSVFVINISRVNVKIGRGRDIN